MIELPPFPSSGDIMALADKVVEAAEKAIAEERKRYQWPGTEPGTYVAEITRLIPPRFKYFTERDPGDLDLMFESLELILSGLRTGTAGKDVAITDLLRDWDGDAKTAFGTGFLYKIAPASQLQIEVANELQLELSAYRRLLVTSREDIIKIGTKTVELLEEIKDTGKFGGPFQLGLVGVGIGVAAAVNAGPFGLAMATSAGVPSGWSVVLSEFEKPWVEGDASVQETLNSMEDQIMALKGAMNKREEQLAAEAKKALEYLLGRDWALAKARDANATRLSNDDRAMVVPAPQLVSYKPGDPIDFTWKGV